jgi:protein-tyrosine phosphatase
VDVSQGGGSAGQILVVCTGNVCRSPYIERLLSARLAGTGIEVSSAGTDALVGSPMDPQVEKRLIQAGGDPSGFSARQLTADLVRRADLVLCATRDHRSSIVRLEPKGVRYAHTLADFSDLVAVCSQTPAPSYSDGTVVRRVASEAILSRDAIVPRTVEDADIIDPIGRPSAVFTKMSRQVAESLPAVVNTFQRLLAV